MRRFGRYSQLHPGTKLRIIGLNGFVRGATNSFIWSNITDRWGEIAWLRKELDECEKNDERAIIIQHIPPFDSFGLNGSDNL